jgi:hypothetical protein
MLTSLPRRLAMVLALAVATGCSDDDPTGPGDEVNFDGIIANCVRGDVANASTTNQVKNGTVNESDCFNTEQFDGRVEAWRLPQTSFGSEVALAVELLADFDGVILVLNEDGELVDFSDDDLGGDLGHEYLEIDFDEDPGEPTYYIAVFAYDEEEPGDYELTVGPLPPI